MRAQPLVDQPRGEAEAACKALRKAPREASQFVFRVIGMGWNADDKLDRFPFLDQRRDDRKPGAIILGTDGGERVRDSDRQIADRNANAFFAEVECENRSGPRVSGER